MAGNTDSQKAIQDLRRIRGVFTKQVWGGRKGDDAINCGEEEFDATYEVLKLSAEQIAELQDGHVSSDSIGRNVVGWEGPCEVRLVESVTTYFGVDSLGEISSELLNQARDAFEAEMATAEDAPGQERFGAVEKFRVIGAHPDRTFFAIGVEAKDALSAFGAAALLLREAGEGGDAEFYAALPEGGEYELPGEGVVCLATVLDPEQADVFGLEQEGLTDDRPRSSM